MANRFGILDWFGARLVLVAAVLCMAASAQESQVEWPMEELRKVPKVYDAQEYKTNAVEVAFLEGLPWHGKATRMFCYYGVPKHASGAKVPGVVLVHGGYGSAFYRWVKFWNDRGYAAVSMDTCGFISGNTVGEEQFGHIRHACGGPCGWGGFDQLSEKISDQWMYHAVADAIIANSFLRSLPGVDQNRIGITGVSWGGVIACIAAAKDDRFCFAAPVYGCGGFLRNSPMWREEVAKMGAEGVAKWERLWDPTLFLPDLKVSVLWLAGTNDRAFSIPALMKSFGSVKGEKHLSLKVRLPHGHWPVSEEAPEVTAFADSLCKGGRRLTNLAPVEFCRASRHASCEVSADAMPKEVCLVYTDGTDDSWEKREWKINAAKLDAQGKRIEAEVPASATAFFFNVVDSEGRVSSSVVLGQQLDGCK